MSNNSIHTNLKTVLLRLFIIFLSIILTVYLVESPSFHQFLDNANNFAFIGSFIAGIFFTSTFTVAPATVTLFILGKKHNPVLIAISGALGAMVGDNLLLKFIKSELEKNLYAFIIPRHTRAIRKILNTRVFYWLIASVGILVIASPLPDELGISILSLIHFKIRHFLIISFIVNFLGIFLITSIAKIRY